MDLIKEFEKAGGIFITPPDSISASLKNVRAFVFDWDGVFNDGAKSKGHDSSFSEIDSMGINILRFDFWLRKNSFPLLFIISGMSNQTAADYAVREHFDGIFHNSKNKREALNSICSNNHITASEIVYVFDDVLDLDVAKMSGLSFCAGRRSNPLLNDYIMTNKICDYITGCPGGGNAVREVCELIMGLSGNYNKAVELRIKFNGEYEKYLEERKKIVSKVVLV